MQHQVTTADVFHDKVNPGLSLEASMQIDQKWVTLLVRYQEDSLL